MERPEVAENLRQEALLRHLLRTKDVAKDELLYSFLLGSRLFLSPHQLLTELHRLSTEDTEDRQLQSGVAGNVCAKCREVQIKSNDQSHSATRTPTAKFVSTTFVNVNAQIGVITDGEGTVRRRRRWRKQTESPSAVPEEPVARKASPLDRFSRDSGILSAILDYEILDNNNSKAAELHSLEEFDQCNDSGFNFADDTEEACLRCSHDENTVSSKQHLVHVLYEWVRHFPADFRNKKIMWTLNDIIKGCQGDSEVLSRLCTEVLDCISRRTAAQESYEQQLNELQQEATLKRTIQCSAKDWMLKVVLNMKDAADVNVMAQQLCLIEMDFLKHVGAEEFLQLFTADGDEDTKTNLGACVRWFNRLSHLVATTVCLSRKRKQARHVITFFARVANRCFELSNFNSSMAILTGLSLGPVTRLKKTWNKLVLSELTRLQNVFDPTNNFLNYRSIYMTRAEKIHSASSPGESRCRDDAANRFSIISQHSIVSENSTTSQQGDSGIECDHDTPTPGCKTSACYGFERTSRNHFTFDRRKVHEDGVMVPFLVLLVKDVYFLNHAKQTIDREGKVNMEKLKQLSSILRPLEEWKQLTCSYHKRDELEDFLLRSPVQDDAELYLLSYKREAPMNRFEKQQLKSLRAERDLKKRSEKR